MNKNLQRWALHKLAEKCEVSTSAFDVDTVEILIGADAGWKLENDEYYPDRVTFGVRATLVEDIFVKNPMNNFLHKKYMAGESFYEPVFEKEFINLNELLAEADSFALEF